MALSSVVETWATKKAQIDKKRLEIEDLQQAMADEIAPLQQSIVDAQTNYNNQIATKNSEITQLEADIKALAIS